MFKINLVPEIQQQKVAAGKRNTYSTVIAVVIIACVVVALLIMGSIRVASGLSLSGTNKDIENVKKESEQYKELEETVLSLEKGLAGINQALNGDNSWTKLLPHLEAATPADVTFVNLDIENGAIKAELKGESVNSLARFVRSYKDYQVIALSGIAQGKTATVSVDGSPTTTAIIKSTGAWNAAIVLDPSADHEIKITDASQTTQTLNYKKDTKAVTWESTQVTASVKNLFTSVESTEYKKEGGAIKFNTNITFAKEFLW